MGIPIRLAPLADFQPKERFSCLMNSEWGAGGLLVPPRFHPLDRSVSNSQVGYLIRFCAAQGLSAPGSTGQRRARIR